jgi:hypothetical protein
LLLRRITIKHAVVDDPALVLIAPSYDLDFKAIALHVNAGRERADCIGDALDAVVFQALSEDAWIEFLAFLLPSFAKRGIDEGFEEERVFLCS